MALIAASSGYSGTPLVKKLGIKSGMHVAFVHAPEGFLSDVLGPLPMDVWVGDWTALGQFDLVHYFCHWRSDLERDILPLMHSIKRNGMIWISWPKKAAKMPGDLDENILREVILPTGLVDVKVCAVDARYSGLKFVIRVALR
jgi:hypothetical protein